MNRPTTVAPTRGNDPQWGLMSPVVPGETVRTMNVSQLPMTHGMEVEQFPADTNSGGVTRVYQRDVTSGGIPGNCIRDSCFTWHRDGSGPQETDFGPYKRCKSMLEKFLGDTEDYIWNWHAADSGGSGAGSHVHFHVEELDDDDTTAEAWAITWNSIVDTAPFFAPFFCHNWQDGFRNGSGAVSRWANPQTTRKRPSTIANEYRAARDYKSVTMNGQSSRKPATIEFRMSDAHPTFAMVGSQLVRKVVKDCLEREWSIKLDQQNGISLEQLYSRIYSGPTHDGETLISMMKKELPEPIVFQDGRGIPGVKKEEFDCMWDVLMKIISQYLPWKGRWDRRVIELVKHAGDWTDEGNSNARLPCPARNNEALWRVTNEDFSWTWGPAPEAHE